MYVRTISRTNKDGSKVTYVQLAHNIWDPKTRCAKAEVVHTFGRTDALDVEALKRLAKSICRFISPEDALAIQGTWGEQRSLAFVKSAPMGGAYLLRRLWEHVGIPRLLARSLNGRSFSSPIEWALFAMVANRALAPASKRAVEEWVREDVALGNPEPIALQHLYRAMDVLLEHQELINREVFFSVADLLNLEVDLLFFDTTSTYLERDEENEGLIRYGHSKDSRPDLPQVVIGLAVTKEGIPVRSWVLPGNTQDVKTIQTVKKDLAGWKLSRCVWVADRGMNSEENRRILQTAGGHYILGEKLRDDQEVHHEVLSRKGRYKIVRENLQVKEVIVGDGERRRRFILVSNPEEAQKDRATREKHLARLEQAIAGLKDQGRTHGKNVCALLTHQSLGRYLRRQKNGALVIDRGKISEEARLDGKYILSTSDDSLSAEDVALGYKQLLEVERAFRTLKTTLELRPLYHRKDDRIASHVFICFLALLLVRIAERTTGLTWDRIRATMERLHLGEFSSKDGRVLQCTEPTPEQVNIFKQLKIPPPTKLQKVDLTP
jgi:transposase